jgi:hypothetical protein
VAQTNNRNLQSATQELINGLAQGNNNLRMNGGYQRTTLSGRTALFSTLQRERSDWSSGECARDHDSITQRATVLHDRRCAAERTRGFRECVQNEVADR